ncbi:pyridoxamine 5'-phosphate oxidase family protein [Mycobacterium sp. URHD0025]|uniref:pyridoxamine 5'-phosphate oxidase family protein n=1 Tax=Mycobacterium sp. URHD0025 TaxID=1298864 RepID=UPI001E3A439E|nr:pyridoxamine 5'-phosphate oxidase family protein [Mycobacterium sp. URHD0025]
MTDADRSVLDDDAWAAIREVVGRAKKSTMHCAIASTDSDGGPHITPVGTIFLREDYTGFYFDEYTSALARNVDHDPRVCVMAVDSGRLFWLRSLLAGRFIAPPAVRLYGTVGALRPATSSELVQVRQSVRTTQWSKGGKMLWSGFSRVRDITFTGFRPVRYPVMMGRLWPGVS